MAGAFATQEERKPLLDLLQRFAHPAAVVFDVAGLHSKTEHGMLPFVDSLYFLYGRAVTARSLDPAKQLFEEYKLGQIASDPFLDNLRQHFPFMASNESVLPDLVMAKKLEIAEHTNDFLCLKPLWNLTSDAAFARIDNQTLARAMLEEIWNAQIHLTATDIAKWQHVLDKAMRGERIALIANSNPMHIFHTLKLLTNHIDGLEIDFDSTNFEAQDTTGAAAKLPAITIRFKMPSTTGMEQRGGEIPLYVSYNCAEGKGEASEDKKPPSCCSFWSCLPSCCASGKSDITGTTVILEQLLKELEAQCTDKASRIRVIIPSKLELSTVKKITRSSKNPIDGITTQNYFKAALRDDKEPIKIEPIRLKRP